MTTTTLPRTDTRHRMLQEIADGRIYLTCTSVRQGLWKPRRHEAREARNQFNLSSSQSRAVNDLLGAFANTPDWDGDMVAHREVRLTGAGLSMLAEWSA